VLVSHGWGYLTSVTGLDRFLTLRALRRSARITRDRHSPPEHLRMAFEELGTTFIKLGQILSTRADLLPPEYISELAKLQDAAPHAPAGVVEKVILAELGRPVEELFACFDPVPIASASIGQVHAATLHDGTEVVVKVRRPGVVEQVENDLEILRNLAQSASKRWHLASEYNLVGLVQEFAETLRAELDYVREGHNAERFAAKFAGNPAIHIPRVFWETSTSRVLTLQRIRGIKISDLAALDEAGIDRVALAQQAAQIIMVMVFEDGFFHADPHPGNFYIEPVPTAGSSGGRTPARARTPAGARIGLIDFGMVGTIDARTREQLVSAFLAVTSHDPERMVDAVLDLGVAARMVDRALLRQDLEHLVWRYYGLPLGEIEVGPLLNEVLAVARRHHLQVPTNLALLIKTMVMNEGLGAQLDPNFHLTTVMQPYAKRLLARQYSPTVWGEQVGRASLDLARLSLELPQQVRRLQRLMSELERGNLEMAVRPSGFEPLLERLEAISNRIVLGIIVAAFIVGLAVLLSVYRLVGWEGWVGSFFVIGFLAALGLGVYLAWSILRARHH
jgi:ubiquinone biosynthesis protein